MPSAEKVERVAALKERIAAADALLLADYRGLTVHDATELRRSLSDSARFSVIKNTLMRRAAEDAGIRELDAFLSGPTAVAFVDGDVIAAAKRIVEAARKFPTLAIKGAYLDGKVLDASSAQALATLESREVMLSKVAGLMKTEMSRAASIFQSLQGRFAGLLEAYRGERTADEPPAEAAAPPQAEEPAGEGPPPSEGQGEPEPPPTPEAEASAANEEE